MRIAKLLIAPELLMFMGSGTFKVVGNPLPEDAQLRQTTIDPVTGFIQIFVESQEFHDVPPGHIAPVLNAPIISRSES